ncbi:MAG TPA: response regulator transcription factor [Cyclobacteriaceae bacterium]|nr:response regulator transcription factor [Cyclobacteriaceae bacterium]MCB9238350.1 response regulator transcription factor [Flammeovirgaceae bacterium]MCB0499074.1 response regulator transcription factor [Cyclobacteriaceae bacterium]MCO5272032.1 response regulator transcription factor [Cyclobacteriaceae bacterium]MCW5902932.1 response regulator transcription factor [Cyclobacteriaceae bacterium]
MEKIKVVIADDHRILRIGIKALLESEPQIDIVSEADDAGHLHAILKAQAVDVVLMDIDLGNSDGIELTREIRESYPGIRVLALTQHEEHGQILAMLDAGASGYLIKSCGKEELVASIFAVAKGEKYFSQGVSAALLRVLNHPRKTPAASPGTALTDREKEVVRLIAREMSNQEIAEKLFISVRTVDTHRRNIMEKIQARNTAGLVKYALENGLL